MLSLKHLNSALISGLVFPDFPQHFSQKSTLPVEPQVAQNLAQLLRVEE